jgi:dienelactone hydrolase
MRLFRLPLITLLAASLCGCASTAMQYETLQSEAEASGFRPMRFGAAPPLVGMLRARDASSSLWVVIEGDGRAWLSMHEPSRDPTPVDAVGWRLARTLSAPNVLYLTRPCQFLQPAAPNDCSSTDWTTARFSAKWVRRSDEAIDAAKRASGAKRVVLAGYSGGGQMAALLAERRDDVAALITVAAPLDQAAWTAYHHVSPLADSLDAGTQKSRLFGLPQLHIAGADDKVVPPLLTEEFLRGYPPDAPAQMLVLPEVDHRMRAAIDLACIRSSSWRVPTAGDPGTCPSLPDRSRPR